MFHSVVQGLSIAYFASDSNVFWESGPPLGFGRLRGDFLLCIPHCWEKVVPRVGGLEAVI